jgi:hypothetical protein
MAAARWKVAASLAGMALMAGLYFLFQIDWQSRAIRLRFDALVELVEKREPLGTLETLGRARQLPDFFVSGARVEYMKGRSLVIDTEAVAGVFVSTWGQVDRVSVLVLRHEVDWEAAGERAVSAINARVTVAGSAMGDRSDMVEYRVEWVRAEDAWRIRDLFVRP